MFKDGKSSINVVIALDLPPSEVETFYNDYLRLSHRHIITQVFDKVKDHVDDFLKYCDIMHKKSDDPTKLKIFDIFYINGRVMDLESQEDILSDNWVKLTSKRDRLGLEIQNRQNHLNVNSIF
jgi:hypothetical protein